MTPVAPPSNQSTTSEDMSLGTLVKTNYRTFFDFKRNNISDDLSSCLEHVVYLTNVAVMTHITKIAAVENQTAIWEYDLDLPGNHALGGSLDLIAAIRTIAIKVCSILVIFCCMVQTLY
jgi:hypothetical protein